MNKTWRPVTASILDIVGGAFNALGFIGILVGMAFIPMTITMSSTVNPMFNTWIVSGILQTILWISAIAALIFALVPIIGGIYAINRRKWGMALAGSIVLFFGCTPLGIASIVLTALSREEFE